MAKTSPDKRNGFLSWIPPSLGPGLPKNLNRAVRREGLEVVGTLEDARGPPSLGRVEAERG